MNELIIFCVGFLLGTINSLLLFKFGINHATSFIYRIKEDIPLAKMGSNTAQEYSGDEIIAEKLK